MRKSTSDDKKFLSPAKVNVMVFVSSNVTLFVGNLFLPRLYFYDPYFIIYILTTEV